MLQEASRTGDVRVIPWETTIGYNLWSYCESDHDEYLLLALTNGNSGCGSIYFA